MKMKMKKKTRTKQNFPLTFYGIRFIVGELLANANMGRNCCQACDFQPTVVWCVQLRYFDAQLAARCHQMMTIIRTGTSQFVRMASVFAVRVIRIPAKEKIRCIFNFRLNAGFRLILDSMDWWAGYKNFATKCFFYRRSVHRIDLTETATR